MPEPFDWWKEHVSSEIYLNTHRGDWWSACRELAAELMEAQTLLDVGTGDGHTLWQVLSLAKQGGSPLANVTTIEPSAAGLARAVRRLGGIGLNVRPLRGAFAAVAGPLIAADEHLDAVSVIHANYHFGKGSDGRIDVDQYFNEMAMLPKLAGKVVLMTTPSTSAYYSIVERDPFGAHAQTERVVRFYEEGGYAVRTIDAPTRFFVAHALFCDAEVVVLWKFFHDTMGDPSAEQIHSFRSRLTGAADNEGFINFQDKIVVVAR